MKILVLAPQPFFQHRGTPIATLKMLRVLSAEGHAVDLLTYHEGESIDVPNCWHVRIPSLPLIKNIPPGFSLRKVIADIVMTICVFRMCLRQHYDVIHAVEESVFMAMLVRAILGIPYIYDMDSSLPKQMQDRFPVLRCLAPGLRFCERQAVRNSDGVVAVCHSLEEVAASHSARVPIVRVEDISLLATNDACDPTAASDSLLNIGGSVVMYVGNLQPYQGIDLLLDAFVHVFHRYEDVHLVIVGGSTKDVHRYRTRAQRIGIAERTHFLGPRPIAQLRRLLEQADILVSPRTMGSNTPMKIFSYLESGTPVLATRLATHTQVLDEEVCVLAEPTPLDMARGMYTLLEDLALREQIATSAQRRVEQCFNVDVFNFKLSRFYQQLAAALDC